MHNLIILLILVSFLVSIIKKYTDKENWELVPQSPTSKCWVSNDDFPEAKIIFESRDIIIQELKSILDSDKWGIWSSDYNSTPIFTKMTDQEITSRIETNMGKIGSNPDPSWRLYGLILNKKVLPTAESCPLTIKLLESSSNRILNAGFSVLEPGCYIGEHQDFNNKFYRLHIPLIIPKPNNKKSNPFVSYSETKKLCVLQVENDYRIWLDNDYFIFDDTCMHNAWNNTSETRIVLLVDLLKD